MAARVVTYVWKFPRPRDEAIARKLMAAAYQTAFAANPNTSCVLIRSQVHATTWKNGMYKRDAPHITICSKNPAQTQQENHEAIHGYTKSLKDTEVIKIISSGVEKPDSTKDAQGREIWPSGLPSEEVVHS